MKNKFYALALFAALLFSCNDKHADLENGLYAEIETNKGTILLSLNYEKAPVTVANFVTLAEGKNTFVDKAYSGKPFYDNLRFHRVIPNFMIQGGDPAGTGAGDSGYKFKDEISDLKHDKPGVLSMANSGPGTNSSQFFITHVPTPWLDGLHTVFGQVVQGQQVVDAIVQDDAIKKVEIIRIGEAAKRFDAVKTFNDYFVNESERQKQMKQLSDENQKRYTEKYAAVIDQKLAEFASLRKSAKKTTSGLEYVILRKGSGEKPKQGAAVSMNYSGFLNNGFLFDSNESKIATDFGKFDPNREAGGGYKPVEFPYGKPMIPGFTEGLGLMHFGDRALLFIPAALGYGAQGAGEVIPPNADLIFEVELLKQN